MKPVLIYQFTEEELLARDKRLIKETIAELKADRQLLSLDEDKPMSYFQEKLPNCKDPKTFRKLVRTKQIKPYRVIGNIPMHKPSDFLK